LLNLFLLNFFFLIFLFFLLYFSLYFFFTFSRLGICTIFLFLLLVFLLLLLIFFFLLLGLNFFLYFFLTTYSRHFANGLSGLGQECCYSKHLTCTFTVRGCDYWSVHIQEPAFLEELMCSIGKVVSNTSNCTK